MAAVHLKVDAINGFKAIRVHFAQVLDLQVLILNLESGDFEGNSLIVLLVDIGELKRIAIRHLMGLLAETLDFFYLCVASLLAAHREAEADRAPFSDTSWKHSG